MISKKAVADVGGFLTPSDFYRPVHEHICVAIYAVTSAGEAADAITVAAELEKRGQLRKVGGAPYLHTLTSTTPTAANAEYYARIVVDKARLRRVGELGARLQQLAFLEATTTDEVNECLGKAEEFFRAVHEPDDKSAGFDDLIAGWREWQENSATAIATPWEALNLRLNGGLERGKLYVLAARPGLGKSVGALNITSNAAAWGFRSTLFSLEMGKNEVASRLLAAGATVNLSSINLKRLDLEELHAVDNWVATNKGMPIQVVDRETITVEQIVSHCRAVGPLDVVAVDYMQLIRATDPRVSREQQVAHMSRSLKIAARELNVAMVVCAQLNRGPVRDGKPRAPTIADLRESGAIEQDADVVLLLHNDEDDPGFVQMIIGKNRNGKTGDIVLTFEGQFARIT